MFRELVVTKSEVTASVKLRYAGFAVLVESAAFSRNEYVPAVVGVPASRPPEESERPGGKEPAFTTDQTMEAAPDAESWNE